MHSASASESGDADDPVGQGSWVCVLFRWAPESERCDPAQLFLKGRQVQSVCLHWGWSVLLWLMMSCTFNLF